MKTSLIIFGVIFLVIGGLLYFVPMQEISADTTTVGKDETDTRTSSASISVPIEWAIASLIIGLILLMLGILISNTTKANNSKNHYNKVIESKENISVDEGNKHKIARERRERSKKDGGN